jgi:uncharacterized protein
MLALVTAALLAATPAVNASVGPGFDCAKASAPDEKLVCEHPELASADRRLAVLYSWRHGLAERGTRERERETQRAWLARRAACAAGKRAPAGDDAKVACLLALYRSRITELAKAVGPVPDAILVWHGQHESKQDCQSIDVAWPELQATALPGAAVFNAYFAEKPWPSDCFDPKNPDGADLEAYSMAEYSRSSALKWKTERFVTFARTTSGYDAGAVHGYSSTDLVTFDLVEGAKIGPNEVFSADAAVRAKLVAFLEKRFRRNGRELFTDKLPKETFADGNWGFTADGATVHFSPYEIASYADGHFEATFTWEELGLFLRAGAPFPVR